MEKVKVLIVGSGVAGAVRHLPIFKNHPEAELAGMVDPDLARARQVADENGIPGAYPSLEEGLRGSSRSALRRRPTRISPFMPSSTARMFFWKNRSPSLWRRRAR
jgi:hypothetical protein